MATILTGIIVGTLTDSKENISDATKRKDVENGKSPSKYHKYKPMLPFRKSSFAKNVSFINSL